MEREEKVLVLTPVKDAEPLLESYMESLYRLTYPRELMSLGFLESDSSDGTFPALQKKLPDLERDFRSAGLWKRDFGFRIPPGHRRWDAEIQIERRRILARSRNHLLFHALDDEDWVLWMDVDLVEYPPDMVQRLLETGKDVVQPHCVMEPGGTSYDLNAWRDKGRRHMHDLRSEGDLVRLHGVGATMLLVRADIHRDGLIFPPFLYGKKNRLIRRNNRFCTLGSMGGFLRGDHRGEIETEGLGMMAHDMGHTCWGMPRLEIRHRKG